MSDPFKFFCIRGYMKSGTNWMCRLLNQHPKVHCIGEFHWETFYRAAAENVNRIAPKRQEQLKATLDSQLQQMVRSSLIELSGRSSGIIGDRTPTTIAPIVMHVPHIVMVRDFRDVIVSRMFHLYNNPRITTIFERSQVMSRRLENFKNDCWFFREYPEQLLDCEEVVRDSASEWAEQMRCDRETAAANEQLPVLFVRYEDLHSRFDAKLAEVFSFLGLSKPADITETLKPGHAQENPNQLNRKGQVGDWKNYVDQKVMNWLIDSTGGEFHSADSAVF